MPPPCKETVLCMQQAGTCLPYVLSITLQNMAKLESLNSMPCSHLSNFALAHCFDLLQPTSNTSW